MTRTLKVFGGSPDGKHRVIMAAPSLTAFCRAHHHLRRDYSAETGNEAEVTLCLANPGVMFRRVATDRDAPFVEWDGK
jgi:hypothetical protein